MTREERTKLASIIRVAENALERALDLTFDRRAPEERDPEKAWYHGAIWSAHQAIETLADELR